MQQQSHIRALILASTSPYRKILLERLRLPFEVRAPRVDETREPGESATALVARLAAAKADAVARQCPAAVVIGADQVACCDGEIVGKPKTEQRAEQQLAAFSGKAVDFLSAVSLRCMETGFAFDCTVPTRVSFRHLTAEEIRRYVRLDNPLHCAGSFKSEEAGLSLLTALQSEDPSAIIGLPLIQVSEALRQAGYDIP
jgi:septum formation protein